MGFRCRGWHFPDGHAFYQIVRDTAHFACHAGEITHTSRAEITPRKGPIFHAGNAVSFTND